jgi:hypothetical protein
MEITFRMEIMIENTPGKMIHNMNAADMQMYHGLDTRKSALTEQLKILMLHDHDI